ncbi:response regulator [Lusitaniella coriacea LEGE 07157]|uniref:Response regulator n=1 Tax=Lusitaniella coriacea LEGE 07157 TaxID=945747 RepID=A0A8J7DW18_9CYAN|nr:response regulator [Lusitaniella coriacea]MBE9116078.1 response regulator [Lusitaniella coriacea LEGE 07157]
MTKILVIEDEGAVRNNILMLLKAEGFQVSGAENGEVGIEMAKEHPPDLIICDILMPGVDGYGVLTQLRQSRTTAFIPFIFLTAKAERSEVRQGIELGADDYLTKPFDADELLGAIAARLKKQEQLYQRFDLLSDELDRFEQLVTAKDEMLTHFNEQMRSPLSNLRLVVEMLSNESEPEKRDRYLEILRSEFEREIALLNQVSELQKLLTPENVNLLSKFNMLKPQ